MALILASQSPRRRNLMQLFRCPFSVQVADIDETMNPNAAPYDEVARISRLKAEAVSRNPEDVVVSADTVVVLENEVLGKPKDEADAKRMLHALSGRDHQVMTGMTVLRGDTAVTVTEVTHIHFRPLTSKEIDRYALSGEPMDKAGSYGIQGGAALFAEKMDGDYYNVMGLPVCRLFSILQQIAPEMLDV